MSVPSHNFAYTDGEQAAPMAVREALAPQFSVVPATREERRRLRKPPEWVTFVLEGPYEPDQLPAQIVLRADTRPTAVWDGRADGLCRTNFGV